MNKWSLICSTFLGTINLLHFTLVFVFTFVIISYFSFLPSHFRSMEQILMLMFSLPYVLSFCFFPSLLAWQYHTFPHTDTSTIFPFIVLPSPHFSLLPCFFHSFLPSSCPTVVIWLSPLHNTVTLLRLLQHIHTATAHFYGTITLSWHYDTFTIQSDCHGIITFPWHHQSAALSHCQVSTLFPAINLFSSFPSSFLPSFLLLALIYFDFSFISTIALDFLFDEDSPQHHNTIAIIKYAIGIFLYEF